LSLIADEPGRVKKNHKHYVTKKASASNYSSAADRAAMMKTSQGDGVT